MKPKLIAASALLTCFLTAGYAAASPDTASLPVTSDLKVPGANLPAGTYTVSLEDRLIDRAVIRITSSTSDTHFLLLAVPSKRLPNSGETFSYFTADSGQALRAWRCQDCASPLELVYPKAEAVALTASSGKPVLAMDPEYDKLPSNLNQDDMKVVTLWLVKPQTVTADNKGQGVTAAKLADLRGEGADAAQSSKKPAQETLMASVKSPQRRLPHTGSNTFAFLTAGAALLSGALFLRLRSSQRA